MEKKFLLEGSASPFARCDLDDVNQCSVYVSKKFTNFVLFSTQFLWLMSFLRCEKVHSHLIETYSRFQFAFEKSLRMFVCKFRMFVAKFQCLF